MGLSQRPKGHRRERKKRKGPMQTTVSSHTERQSGRQSDAPAAATGTLSEDTVTAAPRRTEQIVYSSAPKLHPEYKPESAPTHDTSDEASSKHNSWKHFSEHSFRLSTCVFVTLKTFNHLSHYNS